MEPETEGQAWGWCQMAVLHRRARKWGCRRKQGWGQEGGCGLLGTRGQARAGREGLGPAC